MYHSTARMHAEPASAADKLRQWIVNTRTSVGLSQRDFASEYYQGSQSCQARYENGEMLPNRVRAQQLMSMVPQAEAAEFENLLIRARLHRAAKMERSGNKLAAAMERSEMPVVFAEETLRHTNDPDAWHARDDLPRWSECVQPAQHRGQYLHAARQVLGLTGEDVGDKKGKGHFVTILKAEREHHAQIEPQLVDYYQQQLQAKGKAALFDATAFHALPAAPCPHR